MSAVGGGGAQPGCGVCARWHTGLADGSRESVQMGECQGDSSPQRLHPLPRPQGAEPQSAGKLKRTRPASSCRGRGRDVGSLLLLLSRGGPISTLPPAPWMWPRPRQHSQRHLPHFRSAARPGSPVPGSGFFLLNPTAGPALPRRGRSCACRARPEAGPRQNRIHPDSKATETRRGRRGGRSPR